MLISCACAASSCACAVMTSDLAAVPALYWFCVMSSERWYCLTVSTSRSSSGIGLAQLHIGERQRGLRRQRGVGEIGGADLRAGALLLDGAAHLAPDVERPTGADLCVEQIADLPRARRARQRGIEIESRIKSRARLGDQRQRLAIIGLVGLQGLVGDRDLRLQPVELGIAEQLPPFALGEVVARRGGLPALDFLVLGGNDRGGALIVGPDGGAADQRQRQSRRRPGRPTTKDHDPAPATRAGSSRK